MIKPRSDRDPETIVFDRLEEEFGDGIDPALLHEIAREEVEGFESARVRDFVPIIAWRQARARVVLHLRATGVVELDARRQRRLG
jgi:hypothetical protein